METGKILSQDNFNLFYRRSECKKSKMTVVIVHGFAEHSGRYGHVMSLLNGAGMSAYALDLRGHGYSDGKRGYIDKLDDYINDIDAIINHAKKSHPKQKIVLLGHSMGGLAATLYASHHGNKIDALVLSCPLFAIKVRVARWKANLGKVMSHLLPAFEMSNQINANILSHDIKMVKDYEQDPLIFHTVTARWFDEVIHVTPRLKEAAKNIKVPLFEQLGTDDRIVDFETAYHWFDTCETPQKTRILYDGLFHEIYNELERKKTLTDLVNWLQKINKGVAAPLEELPA